MISKPVYLVGGGGHAKVVIAALREAGLSVGGVFDDDPAKYGLSMQGVKVIGPIEQALSYTDRGKFIIAIGDNVRRGQMIERLDGLQWQTVIHPKAYVHESVRIGAGTLVTAGVVIQPDTIVGQHCIINTGSTIDHDCRISSFAHIAPGAHLAGAVQVGEGAMIGVGSSIIPNIKVGSWVTVGAGSVVVRDLPSGITAAGAPARELKTGNLRDER